MGVAGILIFFIIVIALFLAGGLFALRTGRREYNNLVKGIGVMLLLLAAVTFIITVLAIYWIVR